ncbi:MAG: Gfo/Idh/MocA family oxidoreductase [Thaumarchaeota archaeon]|nr:Gfo/Idh/MocA family oxidoreductase [Nitrososphaerota archaeon]
MSQIKIGMVGGGAIARAHVLAYSSVPILHDLQVKPVLSNLAEANVDLAIQAASKLGFENHTADWRTLTSSSDIDLVDIVAPTYLHAEVAIDAAEHGKAILCEKPIATTAADAKKMYEAASRAGVVNGVGFNYRRLSAILLAKKLITEGALGKITQFRTNFLEDWASNPKMAFTWRYKKITAGGGALADLGSHIIDVSRFLMGEIKSVCGMQETFIENRKLPNDRSKSEQVDVDDYTTALVRFANGVPGTIETSWATVGRKVALQIEVNGSEGSVYYNFENPNDLHYYSGADPNDRQGHRTIIMGTAHPYGTSFTFPATGSGAGFQDSINNEIYEVVNAVMKRSSLAPSFYDGWKVNQVIEAIQESSSKKKWVDLE